MFRMTISADVVIAMSTAVLAAGTATSAYFSMRAARATEHVTELEADPILFVEPIVDERVNTILLDEETHKYGLLFSYDREKRYVATTNTIRVRNVGRSPAYGIELFCQLDYGGRKEQSKLLDLAGIAPGDYLDIIFDNRTSEPAFITFAPVARGETRAIPATFSTLNTEIPSPTIQWVYRRNKRVLSSFALKRDRSEIRLYCDGPIRIPPSGEVTSRTSLTVVSAVRNDHQGKRRLAPAE